MSSPTLLPSRPTSAAGDPRSFLSRGCRVLCCSRRPGGEVGAPLAKHPTSGRQPTSRLPLPPRYHGSFWRALSACFPPRWHLALLFIGGSAYLDLQQGDRLSPYLALTCLCHLLALALGLQVRHRHPAPARAPRGCSAHGAGCLAPYPRYSPPARCPAAGGTNSTWLGSAPQSYALGSTLPGVHPEGPVLLRLMKAAAPWHGHQPCTARALQG